MQVQKIVEQIDGIGSQISDFKANAEKEIKKVSGNMNKLEIQSREHADRLLQIEQGGAASYASASTIHGSSRISVAQKFRQSDQIQDFIAGRTKSAGVNVNAREILNNTIVTADPTSPPQQLPGVVGGPAKPLGLRQYFTNIPATGGSFSYSKENVFTNAAAAQAGDGAEKAESGITFTEVVQAISTYAHWLKISKQVLSDAPQTVDFIAARLINGLESKIEDGILNGDGTSSALSGLLDTGNFTAHSPAGGSDGIENLRAAKADLQAADFNCNLFILNPADAEAIDLIQDTTGQFVYGSPRGADGTEIWGVPVFVSTHLTAGQFVALDTQQAATVHTREDALITLSNSDDDNFTKNLATMICEARLGFAVHHATGVISGALNGA